METKEGKEERKWYVVCDKEHADPKESVWTLSLDPKLEGWETDNGYPGYGLRRKDAEELATKANAHDELVEALNRAAGALEQMVYGASPNWNESQAEFAYKIIKAALSQIQGEKKP